MPTIVDSYSEANYSGTSFVVYASQPGAGQAFTGDGGTLNSAQFYVQKSGSPTGTVVAKIYAETHATAYGTDSVPTGAALATSDTVDVSTLSTSFALQTFTFSGANKITLSNGTHYIVTLEYTGGDFSNSVFVGLDNTSPTHAGNSVENTNSHPGWFSISSEDTCFYVYKDSATTSSTSTTTTSTSTTTTSTTTTLPFDAYGAKVFKPGNPQGLSPRNFYLNSHYKLLKVFQQGSFKLTVPKGDAGGTLTIGFPKLNCRPLVLVWMQRYNSDGTLDSNYHFGEWSYWGASKVGWQSVSIYNDHILIGYRDQIVEELLAATFSVLGYYYIFTEEVDA